ncbi:hypothetical protein SUDANB126_04110 [Streptomyces sp. enrichment culture]
MLPEVGADCPGGSSNGARRLGPGRRGATQTLLVERPSPPWRPIHYGVPRDDAPLVHPAHRASLAHSAHRASLAHPVHRAPLAPLAPRPETARRPGGPSAGPGPAGGPGRPGRRRRPRLRAPRREGRPAPLSPGEREAVGPSPSGRASLPTCAAPGHRRKWKPGRERSMSCSVGPHPSAPPCPSAPATLRLPSGTPSSRTAAGASSPRRGRGGNRGLPAAASGRDGRAPAGRGWDEAPVRRAGTAIDDRGGGVPRRPGRATTAATDPYDTPRKQALSWQPHPSCNCRSSVNA